MDSTGNIVVVGSTLSLDFPLTSDAYDNSNVAGPQGATIGFIAKVSSDGSKLVYSTYFGGAAYGGGYGSTINAVAVDPATGNILVAGTTYSNTFPTTTGVLQTTNLGAAIGHCTAFVSEFDPTGATLLWSTYLGGRGNYYGDYANACAFDASSDPVIAGATFSSDFPTTTGCPQASNHAFAAFECNAFVTKLNPSGTTLLSSTYLGGSIEDGATSVAVDSSGHIFVAGQSYSGDFPVSTSAYQKSNKAIDHGACNGFVTELSADGKTVLFSTLLGGSGGDAITALALDSIGEPTVAGWTYSKNFPVTANAYQRANAGVANHASNAFVTKIKSNGKGLVYSTYLGGSGLANGYGDQANALAFDAADDPMVVGSSFSGNFPTTPNSGQQNNAGFANSVDNAFLVQLNSTATSLLYSSYYGGSGSSEPNNWFQGDSAVAIVPVSSSQFDMVGTAYSYSLPAASAGFQTGTNGPPDVFLTDFRIW
jgi:hypothetical protein